MESDNRFILFKSSALKLIVGVRTSQGFGTNLRAVKKKNAYKDNCN